MIWICFIGVGLFLAVLIVRTLLFSSQQLKIEKAELAAVDADGAAGRLAQAIKLRTISGDADSTFEPEPFLAFHTLLEKLFPRLHQELDKELINQYSLLYKWPGRNPELAPMAFLAHIDVVPIEPGTEKDWAFEPFGGDIADGFVWGRGTLDMKGTLMAIMESIEALIEQDFRPERSVYLAFGHDEEIGGKQGAARIAAHLQKQGVRLAWTLDEGMVVLDDNLSPTGKHLGVIGIAEKGYVSLKLKATGQGGHSSMPTAATTIGRLCQAINRLEKKQMPATLDGPAAAFFRQVGPDMPFGKKLLFANQWLFRPLILGALEKTNTTNAMIRTTTAPTMIQGGIKENVLPGNAQAMVNFRILPGDSVAGVVQHVKQVIADDAIDVEIQKTLLTEPPAVSDPNAAAFSLISKTLAQVFPETAASPGLVCGATDSKHYNSVSDNCYRFAPFIFGPEDTPRIHGTDERVSIAGYVRAIQYYMQYIKNAA